MSHLLQQKEKQVLITSHMLVMAAWEFVPRNIPRNQYNSEQMDRGMRIPALICTAPLSRALVANVFVQTRKHLQHNAVEFFLNDKVIPAFRIPILFVYCVLMDWCDSSGVNLISTVQRISETMPHIQTLDLEELPKLDGTEQQIALAAALPKTLWSLRLVNPRCYFGAGFVSQLAESCPFLQRLDVTPLDSDAYKALFSKEKNLFPNLKMLSVETIAGASLELYDRAFTSQVVSSARLESFEFLTGRTQRPLPAPSLRPLEHLRSISSLLVDSTLSTIPNFSVLNCCSELTRLLHGARFTSDQQQQQQQQQVVIDLSGMPCLTSLGQGTLSQCRGVHTLVLPPTLRTVESGFCEYSSVQHIDFSLCAESLRFVDTYCFLAYTEQVETFSTLPLLGKIGTVVGSMFLYHCSQLRRADLAGLQGIVEINDYFLSWTAVEELDLSALGPTCTKIGEGFLLQCSLLEKVTGCDGLRNVKSVGSDFLAGTKKLAQFDFAAMQALEVVDLYGLLSASPLREEGTKILSHILKKNRQITCSRRDMKESKRS